MAPQVVAAKRKLDNASYRRSPFLISYWLSRTQIFENYLTKQRVAGDALAASILQFCSQGRTILEIQEYCREEHPHSLQRGIWKLLKYNLLELSSKEDQRARKQWESWQAWTPSASYFHFASKDAKYGRGVLEDFSKLRELAKGTPLPENPRKHIQGEAIQLEHYSAAGEFMRVMQQRRTWREFSNKPVERTAFEQLLWLSFGVQGWVKIDGVGRLPLKTSPSGGSLHPLEAYVAVCNVHGIRPGLYRYDCANHRLEKLGAALTKAEIAKYLAGQSYFSGAAFVIFLTAFFPRTQWKYHHPRAYRVVLAEAGHLCQTFCLTATWLGLAPFCTMALADTKIETALKIDGVRESVLYAMGAGIRPARAATAERLRMRD